MGAQQGIRLSTFESQHPTNLSQGSSARDPVQTFSVQPSQHDVTPTQQGGNDDLEHGSTAQSASYGTGLATEARRKSKYLCVYGDHDIDARKDDPGHIGLSVLQGTDPSFRFFSPRAEAASIVQWLMDQKILKHYDEYCDAYQVGNKMGSEDAAEKLIKAVSECC